MRGIFITATDTGAGKTLVVGLLARYLSEKGFKVITQKWIATGERGDFSKDIELHLKIMGKTKSDIQDYLKPVSPYTFRLAGSPHLAAQAENKRISTNKIIKGFKVLSQKFDFVLVEGIGGALVPFTQKRLVIDIVKNLDLGVLVVTQNRLGAINHTLLTIEALRERRIKILGIIFNNLKQEDKQILKDNPYIIKKLTKQRIFGVLPWMNNYNQLYKRFIPLGDRIYRVIKQ